MPVGKATKKVDTKVDSKVDDKVVEKTTPNLEGQVKTLTEQVQSLVQIMIKSNAKEFNSEKLTQDPAEMTLPEIGSQKLEIIDGASLFKDDKDGKMLQAFMEERVEIQITPTAVADGDAIACPSVNGVSQPIFCGRRQRVKRKYIEALARNRVTDVFQSQYSDPLMYADNLRLSRNTNLAFTIVSYGDSETGQRWLDKILREA